MTISSRTPEGDPYLCRICGQIAPLETSSAGDSLCPRCGQLLWQLRDCLGDTAPSQDLPVQFDKSDFDSLEIVELVMRFEDRFGVSPTDAEYEQMKTLEDLLRWLRRSMD